MKNPTLQEHQGDLIKLNLTGIELLREQVAQLQDLVIELENFRLSATHNIEYREGSKSLAPILIKEN